jgi:hypothetical protein
LRNKTLYAKLFCGCGICIVKTREKKNEKVCIAILVAVYMSKGKK